MSASRYRATINGFVCNTETWDDALERDGKRDEIYFAVNTKRIGRDGTIKHDVTSESQVMGDTLRQNGRVQAGTGSDRGGIRTGDRFPTDTPMLRTIPLDVGRRYPPYTIWEGELADGGDLYMLLPTICEHDDGPDFFQSWLQFQIEIDAKYGQRAKEVFSTIWPVAGPVFDAVSLGLRTLGELNGMWGAFGAPGRRPIGLHRDPANKDGFQFNPNTLALSAETIDEFITQDLTGVGAGLYELTYTDDPHLKGSYTFWVQIEQLGAANVEWSDIGHANGVVAMTTAGGRLFCATTANELWMRDPVHHDVDWQRIGHANGVVGLAAIGDRLFCATDDNRLWTRDTEPRETDWSPIGHANGVVGMTALDGQLFCATKDNGLHVRPPALVDTNWSRVGHANGVLALAAAPGSLYCATSAGLNRRDPVLTDVNWQQIGTAPGVRGLAATGGELFAATSGGRLLVRTRP
jgi:hypothetical protein